MRRLAAAFFSSGVLAVGCTGPSAPNVPPPAASAAPIPDVAPLPTPRASLGPGEIVCGVDDGPVPIGRTPFPPSEEADLRVERSSDAPWTIPFARTRDALSGPLLGEMVAEPPPLVIEPAKPEVKLTWTLPAGLSTTPAFEERAHACGTHGDLPDVGERSFFVQARAGAGPTASRLAEDRSASKLTTCFATALCSLGPSAPAGSGAPASVRLNTTITPAVFRGSVQVEIADERMGPLVGGARGGRGRRLHHEPPPPPRSAASATYAARLAESLRPSAEACARKTPADASYRALVVFVWGKGGKQPLIAGQGQGPLVDGFATCFRAAAEPGVTKPPAGFNPGDRIPIALSVDVQGSSSVPPPRAPAVIRHPR